MMKRSLAPAQTLLGFFCLFTSATAAELFVATNGHSGGDGSRDQPWNLATALGHPAVQPGDTVWIRGGTYSGGFTSTLKGLAEAPVTVRAAPGERATIDCKPRDDKDNGVFLATGEWTTFQGLEFTCSDLKRVTTEKGSWPADIRRGGITSQGSNLKFVNLIVHDTTQGFGFWGNDKSGEGGEIYGCLIYHNGWKGPDRGHGHAIYAQNGRGTKRIVDNVMFNQFGYGLHVYGSEKAFLRGFHIEGNISFNNGVLSDPNTRTTDLVGGSSAIERLRFINNATYGGSGLRLGYAQDVHNKGVDVRGNYIVGGVRLTALDQVNFTNNTLIAPGTLLHFDFPLDGGAQYRVDSNTYLRTKVEWAAFNLMRNKKSEGATFAEWRKRTGFDANSEYAESPPTGTRIIVRPNLYEKGRAHIIVYNWDKRDAIEVDLKDVLAPGQRFRIVSAQNYYGKPVLEGISGGQPIQLPMKPVPPAQPVGMADYQLPVTEPQFGVFVVLPVATR